MPNNITNTLIILDNGGTNIKDIGSTFLNEENNIDFNKIIPSPSCLANCMPSFNDIEEAKLIIKQQKNPLSLSVVFNPKHISLEKCSPEVIRTVANYKECGCYYWYDWNLEHWGTKWNAYGQKNGDLEGCPANGYLGGYPKEFTFETAWSHCNIIIETLSKKLPTVTFQIKYADEDMGSNCGEYTIKNGEIITSSIAPSWNKQTLQEKRDWRKFAFNLCNPNSKPADYGFDENWEYIEE